MCLADRGGRVLGQLGENASVHMATNPTQVGAVPLRSEVKSTDTSKRRVYFAPKARRSPPPTYPRGCRQGASVSIDAPKQRRTEFPGRFFLNRRTIRLMQKSFDSTERNPQENLECGGPSRYVTLLTRTMNLTTRRRKDCSTTNGS